jgi:hypothetical protein
MKPEPRKHPSGRPIRLEKKKPYSLHVPASIEPLTIGLRHDSQKNIIGFVHTFNTEKEE